MVIEGHFLIMLVDSNSWPWLFDSFASGDSVDSSPASPANRYRDLDSQNRVGILFRGDAPLEPSLGATRRCSGGSPLTV